MTDNAGQLYERPALEFDDRVWICILSNWSAASVFEEHVPKGESAGTWTEIVTTHSTIGAQGYSLDEYAQLMRTKVQSRSVDGTFKWRKISESTQDLLYEWTLEGDATTVDQFEVVRLLRGRDAFHSIHFAARGELEAIRPSRDRWLMRLKHASVTYEHPPAYSIPQPMFGAGKRKSVLASVSALPFGAERMTLIQQAIESTDMAVDPLLWAQLHALLGMELMCIPDEHGPLDAAISAFRNALDVLTKDNNFELWVQVMGRLASTFAIRAAASPDHSATDLRHVDETLSYVSSGFPEGSLKYLELLLDFGDTVAQLNPDTAFNAYNQVFTEIENGSHERQDLYAIVERAGHGLQFIDRRGEEPLPELSQHPDRGHAAFLRPLLSAGRLTIMNGFQPDPTWDPPSRQRNEYITLEAAIHRSISAHLVLVSLGGRPEGYGTARLIVAGNGDQNAWHKNAEAMVEIVDLVILVPLASEGVTWEVDMLIRQRLLPKTVFVMPPHATDVNVPDLWIDTTAMMADRGFQLPEYDPNGLLFQFEPHGRVTHRWSFETVWTGTLIDNISHLLPHEKSDQADQPPA